MGEISFWNRYKQKLEVENVYGGDLMALAYGNTLGQGVVDAVLARPGVSKIYGWWQNSRFSQKKIDWFIKNFQIPMEEYESGPFANFNEFFIRRFVKGKRPFNHHDEFMPAFAEGRYLGFESIDLSDKFPVKGVRVTAEKILVEAKEHTAVAARFAGGPMLIARLCPVDYHRFHFPDDGDVETFYRIHGKLHSVNPTALNVRDDVLFTNERAVSILRTKNFGYLAYVEVGALMVGKIVESHPTYTPFKRGDEKGYFLFGGSTVILIGEPGKWKPAPDILEKTRIGIETYIKLGDFVAKKL